MTKINAVALSVVLVPAFSIGPMAFANESYVRTQAGEQRAGETQRTELRLGDMQDTEARQSSMQEVRSGTGAMQGSDTRAGDSQGNVQRSNEKNVSGKFAGGFHADEVIGRNVKQRDSDNDIGEIDDLIIGHGGQVVGAVLKTNGSQGTDGQSVAVSWDRLERTQDGDESVFHMDMEEDTLRNAPEYKKD